MSNTCSKALLKNKEETWKTHCIYLGKNWKPLYNHVRHRNCITKQKQNQKTTEGKKKALTLFSKLLWQVFSEKAAEDLPVCCTWISRLHRYELGLW